MCNLAAQAGVRYSLENPHQYIDVNLKGFFNVLECSKNNDVKHFVYASSSSIYGKNKKTPFEISDKTESPISLYAATKKANELMAHSYSELYKINTTGLRFFTVYGPFGRPDMSYFIFANKIMNNEKIDVYNYGKMERDFTYIDDITDGILKVFFNLKISKKNYNIYNIGNDNPVKLLDFIKILEKKLKTKANKNMLPLQKGDVIKTLADITLSKKEIGYDPIVKIESGLESFVKWFKEYNNIT